MSGASAASHRMGRTAGDDGDAAGSPSIEVVGQAEGPSMMRLAGLRESTVHAKNGGSHTKRTTATAVNCKNRELQILTCNTADNAVRWVDGERLHQLFERRCDQLGTDAAAVVTENAIYTFRDIDNRANQLARYLIEQGTRTGDRVGLLFDKSIDTYIALLAVLKVDAAYVPLDAGFPSERVGFILRDAGVRTVVSHSHFREKLAEFRVACIFIDSSQREIGAMAAVRLSDREKPGPKDELAYIIYTSGTTGTPKGVAVEHSSICNFVKVAAEVYGIRPGDRCYQGMTIAFDFSVEELWVPLIAGAALVPAKAATSLVGNELAEFLREQHVTVLCCVPTLLATIETDLPELRILLVSGEACPYNLVVRWHRPGRTILNAYGPTEATVTATLTELHPDRPVTIGGPLPTYTIVILDPNEDEAVEHGTLGEIGIAGIGLAKGYLNRSDLTAKKFIPDFLGLANNPSGRIYRTGDLGLINDRGQVEFHGRIDTQVKVRGYRIELTEIESVLMQVPEIAQAVVNTYEPEPGVVELAAYYTLKRGVPALSASEIFQSLRRNLPGYMVPAYLKQLDLLPMTAGNKVDRRSLPAPKGLRVAATAANFVAARNETERALTRSLISVMNIERVSIDDDFFQDLGAHSLLMARFCARLRQYPETANVSMRDIYQNPTIAKLAVRLEGAANQNVIASRPEPIHVPSDLSYYGCGALQLLFYAGHGLLLLRVAAFGIEWSVRDVHSPFELYLRAIVAAAAAFAGLSALPIASKWLLIGKWKRERIPIWSLRYFRFWMVKTLVRTAPVAAFVGSPLYNLYLRALGARIGRGAVITSRFIPITTDLFSVGENTILRKDSILLGYRARANFIEIGPIDIGSDAFVGEASVLDIDTAMGDGAQLGHASSLQSGQRVPDGRHYHGSPALECQSDYCPIAPIDCSALRRGLYATFQLVGLIGIAAPISIVALKYWYEIFTHVTGIAIGHFNEPTSGFVSLMLIASAGLLVGGLLLGLAIVYAIPRLCNMFLKPEKTYVLYGFHFWLQTVVSRLSNSRFYNLLFGDSSIIVHYMRFVGWNLNEVEQTGSNFGTNQRHDNPFLCEIGSRTMASDGLSMINMQMSSSSFRLSRTRIGDRNYLGNDIHYPPGGRTGANCLLGTKVMIPIEGPVRENVGLLGSPCFEIPRIVERDKCVNVAFSPQLRRQRIAQKNVHNLVTASLFLLTRWIFLFAVLFVAHLGVESYPAYGTLALLSAAALITLFAIAFFATIERASRAFKRLTPKMVSIYEPYFWAHERHWKLSDSPIIERFGGTPFKNVVSRLVGIKIGRKVYDGGCSITERTLTEIGDCVNLNEGSVLQAHSLEEGVFKSDYVRIGSGSTLAPGAFAHYGVTMGEHVVLDADSFLMKGEVLDHHTVWRGNPAKLVSVIRTQQPAIAPLVAREIVSDEVPELNVAMVAAE
jgi:non-ribosomal peptide synthetase-like protein